MHFFLWFIKQIMILQYMFLFAKLNENWNITKMFSFKVTKLCLHILKKMVNHCLGEFFTVRSSNDSWQEMKRLHKSCIFRITIWLCLLLWYKWNKNKPTKIEQKLSTQFLWQKIKYQMKRLEISNLVCLG